MLVLFTIVDVDIGLVAAVFNCYDDLFIPIILVPVVFAPVVAPVVIPVVAPVVGDVVVFLNCCCGCGCDVDWVFTLLLLNMLGVLLVLLTLIGLVLLLLLIVLFVLLLLLLLLFWEFEYFDILERNDYYVGVSYTININFVLKFWSASILNLYLLFNWHIYSKNSIIFF